MREAMHRRMCEPQTWSSPEAEASIGRCGTMLSAWANSPPGLEPATPAMLWPATPMLDNLQCRYASPTVHDACKMGSPMLRAPVARGDPSGPQILVLSAPGLDAKQSLTNATKAAKKKNKATKSTSLPTGKVDRPAKSDVKSTMYKENADRRVGNPTNNEEASVLQKGLAKANTKQKQSLRRDAVEDARTDQAAATSLREDFPCAVCSDIVHNLSQASGTGEQWLLDGRPVCEACRAIFDVNGFTPKNQVCMNPLCRRKWKQLAPKVLPHFCPPCKRQLEEGLCEVHNALDIEFNEKLCQRWHDISIELSQVLSYPTPSPLPPSCGSLQPFTGDKARERWRTLLEALSGQFPPVPPVDDVRNWNSVHGRKVYYRGVVCRSHLHHVCMLEAQVEVGEDLVTPKKMPSGMRDFPVVDWQHSLQQGDEVVFTAFPNPAVSERESVYRIVRVLAPAAPAPEGAANQPAIASNAAASCESEENPAQLDSMPAPLLIPSPTPNAACSLPPSSEVAFVAPASAPARLVRPSIESPKSGTSLSPDKATEQSVGESKPTKPRSSPGCSLDNSSGDEENVISPCSAFADSAFADLMTWSQDPAAGVDCGFEEHAASTDPSRAFQRVLGDSASTSPIPSVPTASDTVRPPRVPTHTDACPPPASSASVPHGGPAASQPGPRLYSAIDPEVLLNGIAPVASGPKAAAHAKASPQAPMYLSASGAPGKSPLMIVPRSPNATYFGD